MAREDENAGPEVIPINAIFGENFDYNPAADFRPALHAADVILLVDVMSGHETIVYGRDALKQIVASGVARPLKVFRVGIDMETEELEQLLALVRVVKGRDEYLASKPPEPKKNAKKKPKR